MACRTSRAKRELVRIVRTPDGEVRVDPTGRLAGRGAYVCADEACKTTAIKRGALGRALERPVPEAVLTALPTAAFPSTSEGDPDGQE